MKKIFGLVILALMLAVASFAQTDYASFLNRTESAVDNKITINTPISKDIGVTKIIENGQIVYYLDISTTDSYCTAGCSGVTVVFTDGTKWSKPSEEVDMDSGYDGFRYSAFMRMTQADLTKFSTKEIKAYKLYIFERSVDTSSAEIIKGCIAAIMKAT